MKKVITFGTIGNVWFYVHKYAAEYFENGYEVIVTGRRKTDFMQKEVRGIFL